jgi:hypothetical protein
MKAEGILVEYNKFNKCFQTKETEIMLFERKHKFHHSEKESTPNEYAKNLPYILFQPCLKLGIVGVENEITRND